MNDSTMFGLKGFWIPAALYLATFAALNPHLPGLFSTHFYFGGLDSYQNAWNLWWVNHAIGERGSLPWFTAFMHHPAGTTLIGHTLNPFNGLLAMLLLRFLSLVQSHNAIVVFSFVMSGVTAFWLCREMTKSYAGSLLGGAVFTFSSFHFMHADGHLQLTAVEWLPLFVLIWIRFCERPTPGRGALAAMLLWLVALCDLYYFAYCVMTGAIFYAWMAWQRKDPLFLARSDTRRALFAFLALASLTSGVLVAATISFAM